MLASALGLRQRSVELVSGAASRVKRIRVELGPAEVVAALGAGGNRSGTVER